MDRKLTKRISFAGFMKNFEPAKLKRKEKAQRKRIVNDIRKTAKALGKMLERKKAEEVKKRKIKEMWSCARRGDVVLLYWDSELPLRAVLILH